MLWAGLCGATLAAQPAVLEVGAPIETVAFGSCNKVDLPQPAWDSMREHAPDVFVWLGDNVYADSEDVAVHRELYARQKALPAYAAFREAVPILGTWDDHDFGVNDGDGSYPAKAASQSALLSFLDEPEDSPRWEQEGVYASYVLGPEGRRVKLILLDTRYHAEPEGPEATLLGEAQWQWLEAELRGTPTEVTLLASSIQVLPVDHRFEKWSNRPAERQRLLALLCAVQRPGLILLSGDRHMAEVSVLNDASTPYPLWELTSSSLSHAWVGAPGMTEYNRFRVGGQYRVNNFALVHLDWDAAVPQVILELHRSEGGLLSRHAVALEALQPDKAAPAAE